MLRFLPDTFREAILRPIAIAAPDAGVYIEIMAPDFRFLFVLVLLAALALLWLFRRRVAWAALGPAAVLLGVITISFIPWLVTTGNGRYFAAMLLAVGPLCIALVWLLPMTRGFRLLTALCLVALQAFAVQQSSPWQSWGLAQWKEPPAFGVELPPDMLEEPATYVTLTVNSFSLIAPRLPAASRWMNLHYAPAAGSGTPDAQRAQNFLAAATPGRLTLLIPNILQYSGPAGLPDAELARVLNTQLAPHRLELVDAQACRLLRSSGAASMAFRRGALHDTEQARRFGFWACPLKYPAVNPSAGTPPPTTRFDAVFLKVESQCPRFFRPGETGTIAIAGGELRIYADSEMRLYVYDSGAVLYKYYRALNPVTIGTIADILSGKAKVDCGNIRGRSGLPWERGI